MPLTLILSPAIRCAAGETNDEVIFEPFHGFKSATTFGCFVKIVNDAAMQALGGYHGGRMLVLGLGTGLGSAMIRTRLRGDWCRQRRLSDLPEGVETCPNENAFVGGFRLWDGGELGQERMKNGNP